MGLLKKLCGLGPQEVTPEQLAHVLLQGAVQSALQGDGSVDGVLSKADVEVEKTGSYQTELVVYQLFLFDLLVHQTFDEHEDEIRRSLRQVFAEQTAAMVKEAGGEPKSHDEYVTFVEQRFSEYFPAAKRSLESGGRPEAGSMELAEQAYRMITGSEEADLAIVMALTAQWTALYGQMEETLEEEYEVVSG